MRIALVHDQIAEFGGAERVLISLKKAYPQADVYTSFVDKERLGDHWKHFTDWNIIQSWASKIPYFSKLYSPLRFLLPLIWNSFDLSSYDVVICSSSWGMCKGVSLRSSKFQVPNSKKQISDTQELNIKHLELNTHNSKPRYICYLHTPPRYLYGYDESSLKKYWPVKLYALIVNHFLRQYDYQSSQTIDQFIFNAQEIRSRSLKFYRRDGIVIHPPIIGQSPIIKIDPDNKQEYYLSVSRLAPTKHFDLIINAANKKGFRLKIVGNGKEYKALKAIAGPTVELLGGVSDENLHKLYANAKAFIYASVNEDFGMVPVEAMAHGVPVIAYASGGVKETVADNRNGFLYTKLTEDAIIESVNKLESLPVDKYQQMQHKAKLFAQSCNEEIFIEKIQKLLSTFSTK